MEHSYEPSPTPQDAEQLEQLDWETSCLLEELAPQKVCAKRKAEKQYIVIPGDFAKIEALQQATFEKMSRLLGLIEEAIKETPAAEKPAAGEAETDGKGAETADMHVGTAPVVGEEDASKETQVAEKPAAGGAETNGKGTETADTHEGAAPVVGEKDPGKREQPLNEQSAEREGWHAKAWRKQPSHAKQGTERDWWHPAAWESGNQQRRAKKETPAIEKTAAGNEEADEKSAKSDDVLVDTAPGVGKKRLVMRDQPPRGKRSAEREKRQAIACSEQPPPHKARSRTRLEEPSGLGGRRPPALRQ